MDTRRFGRKLRVLRERRRLSQAELAERSGLSRSKVSRIERGAIDRVPFGDIVALATALDARVELDSRGAERPWIGSSMPVTLPSWARSSDG